MDPDALGHAWTRTLYRHVSSLWQIECHRECQNICQKVCQNRCQIGFEKECRIVWQHIQKCIYAIWVIYIYTSKWCQKLCQNSVPGRGSLEVKSFFWAAYIPISFLQDMSHALSTQPGLPILLMAVLPIFCRRDSKVCCLIHQGVPKQIPNKNNVKGVQTQTNIHIYN